MLNVKNAQLKSVARAIKPFVITAEDYHEFGMLQEQLWEAGFSDMNYEELGCDGTYHALFFNGKRTKAIQKLCDTYSDLLEDEE